MEAWASAVAVVSIKVVQFASSACFSFSSPFHSLFSSRVAASGPMPLPVAVEGGAVKNLF